MSLYCRPPHQPLLFLLFSSPPNFIFFPRSPRPRASSTTAGNAKLCKVRSRIVKNICRSLVKSSDNDTARREGLKMSEEVAHRRGIIMPDRLNIIATVDRQVSSSQNQLTRSQKEWLKQNPVQVCMCMLCDAHPQQVPSRKCKTRSRTRRREERHLLTDDNTVSACSASLVVSVIFGFGRAVRAIRVSAAGTTTVQFDAVARASDAVAFARAARAGAGDGRWRRGAGANGRTT